MLVTVWFAIWGVAWAVYFMLDGFDLGLGSLMPLVARDETERRIVVNAMGPFWDGNEVWLITAGGVTFAAFPAAYAAMFSGLYTPLMIILFALILRGVAFEFRGKIDSARWRLAWDACLVVGSLVPALLFGVAFGNIFAGIPLDPQGVFRGTILTLLNPYALLCGALFVVTFALHGANWLAIRTEGRLQARAALAAARLWPAVAALSVAFLVATWFATPLWRNVLARPVLLVLPLVAVAGLVATRLLAARASWWKAWFASSALILGAVLFGVAGLYPSLLPSSLDPSASITVHGSASSALTLKIMLGVVLCVLPVVIGYQSWVYVKFRDILTEKTLSGGMFY